MFNKTFLNVLLFSIKKRQFDFKWLNIWTIYTEGLLIFIQLKKLFFGIASTDSKKCSSLECIIFSKIFDNKDNRLTAIKIFTALSDFFNKNYFWFFSLHREITKAKEYQLLIKKTIT